jgi:5'-nucleotidase
VRILVTNDDGVHAPGLAALTRALARWAAEGTPPGREVVVVAPLANHSGASSAVGTVYERDSISYRTLSVPGAEDVPAYGVDGSPALATIVGALGAFGPAPDLIVSGINLGVNVGRSILHSGTVGAVLTGAQFGLSGLAVSMRSGPEPLPWDTAAQLAVEVLPALAAAPVPTVFNLNVPALATGDLRGVRRGRIGTAGLIRAATDPELDSVQVEGRATGRPVAPGHEGQLRLRLGAAVPALGDIGDEPPEDDAALVTHGFASLTALVGVREASDPGAQGALNDALVSVEKALAAG